MNENKFDNFASIKTKQQIQKCELSWVATLILIYKIEDSYTVPSMRLFWIFNSISLTYENTRVPI